MKNTVIKVLTKEHGKEVIKYWKSLGFDTKGYTGEMCEANNDRYIYYGIINDSFDNYHMRKVINTHTSIIELPTIKQQETMRTIKYSEAQSIIDIACKKWKDILFKNWGKSIVLKNDIEISEEEYKVMRKACDTIQNQLFDKIFGEDSHQFKIGDWVYSKRQFEDFRSEEFIPCFQIAEFDVTYEYARPVKDKSTGVAIKHIRLATPEEIKASVFPDGTPCLVRDGVGVWHLRYADGKGDFYNNGQRSGITSDWKYSMKLDINNLPVNE